LTITRFKAIHFRKTLQVMGARNVSPLVQSLARSIHKGATMAYVNKSGDEGINGGRGSDRLKDSDYVYYIERNPTTTSTTSGTINTWRTTPYGRIAHGMAELDVNGLSLDDPSLDGEADVSFDGVELVPGPSSALTRTTASLAPKAMDALTYEPVSLPESGDSITGNYYAVRTSGGNYAQLRVFKDTVANKVMAEWSTYQLGLGVAVVGRGYRDPRDLVLSVEGGVTFAYVSVLRRLATGATVGAVARVPQLNDSRDFPNLTDVHYLVDWRFQTTRNSPQQLALRGSYLYVANKDAVLRIDLRTKSMADVATGFTNATGLLIDVTPNGKTYAYVTDTANGGRLLRIEINPTTGKALGPPTSYETLQNNLGATGFLEWADEDHTGFYVPLRDSRKLKYVRALDAPSVTIEELSLDPVPPDTTPAAPSQPWSVVVTSETDLCIISDAELGCLERRLLVKPGMLVLGIGLVPFDYIQQNTSDPHVGKANTVGTGYFFKVENAPFGDWLNLMLNHDKAWELGARYYRVRMQDETSTKNICDSFTDFRWDERLARWEPVTTSQRTIGGAVDVYPVRDPTELWYNPYYAARMNTYAVKNGLRTLEIVFLDKDGKPISGLSYTRKLLIDNNWPHASLSLPRIGGKEQTLTCGALQYHAKTDEFLMDYSVSHATNNAFYSLNFYRGGTHLGALAEYRNVALASPPKVTTVGDILGTCNIANVAIYLSVGVRVTNGYHYIGSTGTHLTFTLVPDSVPLH
jgi:hypothetical protein